ncbi:MAG: hypothetical protein JO034_12095 [Singulisphaera sp.]|nr:hypothetical protein [Singulisphaera sp.]
MPRDRIALVFLFALCALARVAPPSLAQDSGPIHVWVQFAPGPYYVGQAIDLQVGAVAGAERPRFGTPRVAGAEIALVGTDVRPISTRGIGDLVTERNLFLWRFRVIPRRAGCLDSPPVVVRLRDRPGTGRMPRPDVLTPPLSGRPKEFLGGVGVFDVVADARPETVRAGQVLEYRVRVTGPAVWGMTAAPDLARFRCVPLGLRVEPMPAEVIADPPSRVFRYRLRPTRAGEAVLPPVAIAALEPKSGRYLTKATSGVLIRAVDVPRFDPATLNYGPSPRAPASRSIRAVTGAVASLSALAVAAVGVFRARGRCRSDHRARRLAARVVRQLDAASGPAEVGRLVTERLVEYLNLMAGRPSGALTPEEAQHGIRQVTRSPDLAARAGALVAHCDGVLYSLDESDTKTLVEEARALFSELERGKGYQESSGAGKPREAVETARR